VKFLLAATYLGPYLGLEAVERALGARRCTLALDGPAADERRRRGLPFLAPRGPLRALLARGGYSALVRGISKTPESANLETRLAREAARRGLPVFAVEDYPGQLTKDQPAPDALFVESEDACGLHRRRGIKSDVRVTGNPRYAAVPAPLSVARRARVRARLGLGKGPVVFWAGQPDAYGSSQTLEALVPHLRRLGASLVYRAHPYTPLDKPALEGLDAVDATGAANPVELAAACDLVATQFSTLAVEAAYAGVPSLFILLPGLGRARHRRSTGVENPPWCRDGLAFLARGRAQIGPALDRALLDARARGRAIAGFRALRATNRASPRRIARLVEKMTFDLV
jgi:hypothetical protein